MAKIIDIRTKRKWKPNTVDGFRVTARRGMLSEAEGRAGGGTGFEPIGLVSDRIVRRIKAR